MHEPLPKKTIADLGALLLHFATLARQLAAAALKKIAPFIRPPLDMEVRCRDGSQYSGFLLIADNDIEAGAVVRSGQDVPAYRPPRPAEWRC